MTSRYVCPPEHAHEATQNCYAKHGCRCDECRTASSEYSYWRKQMRRAGRGPVKSIDATGTHRRLEALMALGWPTSEIARRIGPVDRERPDQRIHQLRVRPRVTPRNAAQVARVYEELWDQRPQPSTPNERHAVTRTLVFAREHGFALPMEWDDIDADEAPQSGEAVDFDHVTVQLVVDGLHPKTTAREREEAARILNARGANDREIAQLLDVADETAFRIRTRLGLPERFGQINGRPGTTRREDAA